MPLPLKPGHTTTEFWLTLVCNLCQTVLASLGVLNTSSAAIGITITTAIYTVIRAALKAKTTPAA